MWTPTGAEGLTAAGGCCGAAADDSCRVLLSGSLLCGSGNGRCCCPAIIGAGDDIRCVPIGTEDSVPCHQDWYTPQGSNDVDPTWSYDSPWETDWRLDLTPVPEGAKVICINLAYRALPGGLGAISQVEDSEGGIATVVSGGGVTEWLVSWRPDSVRAVRAAVTAGETSYPFQLKLTFTVPPRCDLLVVAGNDIIYCQPILYAA